MESASEVARIRERIAREYQAAQQVFTGFTPTARHEYINTRQQNIEAYFQELKQHMSPEAAIGVLVQAEEIVYGFPSSDDLSSSGNTS